MAYGYLQTPPNTIIVLIFVKFGKKEKGTIFFSFITFVITCHLLLFKTS